MPKPLWALAEEASADAKLDSILRGFQNTHRHPTYGPYGIVNGSRINKRSWDAIQIAGYLSGWGHVEFSQGGLNSSVDASADTHVGLDVEDIKVGGHSLDDQIRFCDWLMKCGQTGFIRGVWDNMVHHIHNVDMIAEHAHPSARRQIYAAGWGYVAGGAGLEGAKGARWHGPDRRPILDWDDSKYNPKNGWRP